MLQQLMSFAYEEPVKKQKKKISTAAQTEASGAGGPKSPGLPAACWHASRSSLEPRLAAILSDVLRRKHPSSSSSL